MMDAPGEVLSGAGDKPSRLARLAPFGLSALIFAFDQATKSVIRSSYSELDSQVVIPGFFNIVHAENPGAAFSLLADAPAYVRSGVLIGLAGLVVIAIVLALAGKIALAESKLAKLAFAFILGGAAGNLLDRIVVGTVTDFLEFYAGRYYWPAFNVADSAIFVGAVLLLLDFWRTRKGSDVS